MASWSEYLKPEVIARLAAVGLHSHTAVEGTVSGLHRSPLKGVSPEFDDYREYSFGDDLKNLDWRAYARSDRFYIKRYEEESNLRAVDPARRVGLDEVRPQGDDQVRSRRPRLPPASRPCSSSSATPPD